MEYLNSIKTNSGKVDLSKYLLFILMPISALFYSLKNFRMPNSKYFFWLFCIYFGFVFVIPENISDASDSARYASQLISSNLSYYSFSQLIELLYNPVNGYPDIYQQIVTWLIANFTNDPRWLFAAFATVFGYFYMQNLWILFENIKIEVDFIIFLFIIAFALVNPIWNINGVRMWTAAQIYLYGNLLYFIRGDKKGIFWIIASILFHFSFIFPMILFIIYLFLPKKDLGFFIFFIGASLINQLDLEVINEAISYLPGVFKLVISSYLNPEYISSFLDNKLNFSWHVIFITDLGRWFLYGWIIFIFFTRKESFLNLLHGRELFNFALFLGGWAQIANLLPSGGRFLTISSACFYFVFVLVITKLNKNIAVNRLTQISVPVLLILVIFNIRIGLDYIGHLLFIGNPMIALTFDYQTPIIEYIKSIF